MNLPINRLFLSRLRGDNPGVAWLDYPRLLRGSDGSDSESFDSHSRNRAHLSYDDYAMNSNGFPPWVLAIALIVFGVIMILLILWAARQPINIR